VSEGGLELPLGSSRSVSASASGARQCGSLGSHSPARFPLWRLVTCCALPRPLPGQEGPTEEMCYPLSSQLIAIRRLAGAPNRFEGAMVGVRLLRDGIGRMVRARLHLDPDTTARQSAGRQSTPSCKRRSTIALLFDPHQSCCSSLDAESCK